MLRRTTAALLLASLVGFTSIGCIGQMALAGKVMKFNLDAVENKWGRELLFLCLYIIPVYPIAGAIDLIFINSIEFHTGTNPLTDKPRIALREGSEEVVAPDGSRAASTLNEDGTVGLDITDASGGQHYLLLVPIPGGIEAHDRDGNVLGRVDGRGTLHTANGPLRIPQG